jgi:hypothetical protein
MNAMGVVVVSELSQLPRQIRRVPEKHPIQELTPDRADQSLDERMRKRHVRSRLDLLHLEHAQVGEPAVEAKQRIVVGAEVPRSTRWPWRGLQQRRRLRSRPRWNGGIVRTQLLRRTTHGTPRLTHRSFRIETLAHVNISQVRCATVHRRASRHRVHSHPTTPPIRSGR